MKLILHSRRTTGWLLSQGDVEVHLDLGVTIQGYREANGLAQRAGRGAR